MANLPNRFEGFDATNNELMTYTRQADGTYKVTTDYGGEFDDPVSSETAREAFERKNQYDKEWEEKKAAKEQLAQKKAAEKEAAKAAAKAQRAQRKAAREKTGVSKGLGKPKKQELPKTEITKSAANVSTAKPSTTASVPSMVNKKMESKLKGLGYDQPAINKMKPQEAWAAINKAEQTLGPDTIAEIKKWLKTQSPETQARLGDLLNKGAVREVYNQLPAGWAAKNPTQNVPKAEGSAPAETTAPKAKGGKLRSVSSNPAAKATKDAVVAEASAAGKAAAGAAKEAGPTAKYMQGLGQEFKNLGEATGKGLGKVAGSKVGKAVLNNKMATAYGAIPAAGRAFEIYSDMNKGQSFMEALDKPESNKKLAREAVNTALVGVGSKLGAFGGRFIGAPTLGAAAGGTILPMVGDKAMDAMGILKSEDPKAVANAKMAEPAKSTPSIGIEEASNWLKEKGMDATEGNFQKAFEELSKRQQDQINKTPEPKPSADTYKPSAKDAVAMAEQAVKAPIGIQDKAPEPDIMSFLSNPDTQGMIAELAAKQANRVQSASNIPDFKPAKKNKDEDEEDENGNPSSTTTANVRPPPRFFVNTGRFGTMAGGGSRRSLSGRLF